MIDIGGTLGGIFQTEFDDLTGKSAEAAARPTIEATREAVGLQREFLDELRHQFDVSQEEMAPYREAGERGLSAYEELLADPSAVEDLPGYQFAVEQGNRALSSSGSAKGMMLSGAQLKDVQTFGQKTAMGYRSQMLSEFGQLAGIGQTMTQTSVGARGQMQGQMGASYGEMGNLTQQMGAVQTAALMGGYQARMGLRAAIAEMIGNMFGGGGMCDPAIKENKTPTNDDVIADAFYSLVVEQWNYIDNGEKHIGPYADQFKALFNVGDGHSIPFIDLFGVLAVTVKTQNKRIEELEAKLAEKDDGN